MSTWQCRCQLVVVCTAVASSDAAAPSKGYLSFGASSAAAVVAEMRGNFVVYLLRTLWSGSRRTAQLA